MATAANEPKTAKQVAKAHVLMVVLPCLDRPRCLRAIVTLEREIGPLQALASQMTLFLNF
jgi:hypothetical protein